MKILFVNPTIREHELPYRFPLGLGYLASSLRNQGHLISVLDFNVNRVSQREKREHIAREARNADVVAIGGLVTQFVQIKKLIDMSKDMYPEKTVIAGGPIATHSPEFLLEHTRADVVFLGEAENTMSSYFDCISSGGTIRSVNGIGFRDGNGVVNINPSVKCSNDLDEIPFPAYDLFDFESYISNFYKMRDVRGVNMITTRGCPFSCVFCAHNYNRDVGYRSVSNVIEEIRFLESEWQIKGIMFNDECFTLRKEWVHDFCDSIIALKSDFVLWAQSRADCVDAEMLKHMREAGFKGLFYGVESADPEVLSYMNKKVTVEKVQETIIETMNADIDVYAGFMMGVPGETSKSIQATVDFCKKNKLPLENYAFITPYPGTPLYKSLKAKGVIENEYDYILELNNKDITDLVINLTRWSDNQLADIRSSAISEVKAKLSN